MAQPETPATRVALRTVLIVVMVVLTLYLLYLLRRPIGWLLIATFLAVALSGPVNFLQRRMKRGLAITVVYLGLLAVPIGIGALIVPPLVSEANDLAQNAPQYARDVTSFVEDNERLRKLDQDYDITSKLREQAQKLPERLGGAASTLRDVGLGIVNSIFALVTILILTAFMLGGGRGWIAGGLRYLPEKRAARIERVLQRSASAVGNYVAGALFQATLAGVLAYVVLLILGVPFAGPLALIIFFLDLIPLVGATIGAVLVGVVTLFSNFPTATIIWVIWSIVYQQVENNLIQPQIQKRAVDINPFLVVVAVLFGGTLLGVLGALVAVPVAASIQIALREYLDAREIRPRQEPPPEMPPEDPEPPAEPAPA
ncbi:MAG TPA: AI-2E family transporter [Thermoleophilaceae bacterium]|nr:AI-2E family transporter [Thermoleophilaceae bacterium]